MAGSLTISTLKDSSGVLATQNGMTGIAKAWVNYNGATQTNNSSFNVSSVTRNGTGDYTVNFTTAMANANYSYTVSVAPNYGVTYGWAVAINQASGASQQAPTTSAFRFNTPSSIGTLSYDPIYINVIVCGA
jgi:hypothetical protein